MPSDKAKGNKALVATCVACNEAVSTELAVNLAGMEDGRRKYFVVCVACANKGWRPPGFAGVYTNRQNH
jgi:hypothetical protein